MPDMPNPASIRPYGRSCKWLIYSAAGLTLAFVGIVVWQSWASCRDFHTFTEAALKISESSALLGQLDESRTMAARMAAATGERQWETRYRLLETQLDQAVQAVKLQLPEIADTESARKTDEANQVLLELEHRTLKLIGQGQREAARILLFSPEYETAKRNYAGSLQQIHNTLAAGADSILAAAHVRLDIMLALTGILLPLLLVLWTWVILAARKNSACRMAVEKALRESREEYRMVADFTYEWEMWHAPDGTIRHVSNACERITGHSAAEFMADPDLTLKITHPDDQSKIREHLREYQEQAPVEFDFRIIKPSGDVRWISHLCTAVYAGDNQWLGRYASNRDITDRKQAEEEIKLKTAELQRINVEKDKFFSIIAHDLRCPFNGFLGLTEVMAEELQNLKKEEIQSIAASMRNSAANLFRLLKNLLNWARMEQGLIPFSPALVQLRPVVDESINMVLQSARNKGIDIAYEIPADITVFADSNMLQSVIRNLVSNAVKFTPGGGKVTISAKAAADRSVEIAVKDSGIGMNREIMANLFRIDVKTNRKGTDGEPSAGLGLLLCKEFVEKNGGGIRVESEEGKGSVFYCSIPCKSAAEEKTVIQI